MKTLNYSPNRSRRFIPSFLLIVMLAIFPLVFGRTSLVSESVIPLASGNHKSLNVRAMLENRTVSVYDSLDLDRLGLSKDAYALAEAGWLKLAEEGKVKEPGLITIVDFSQSSTRKRMFVLDMENYRIIFNTLVAHGRNSGKEWAQSFSNTTSSFKSSLGFYITGDTYMGGNGYSMRLNGVEKGINDKANQRAIVMHGADYVSQNFINAQGFLGRSLGCPAVPANEARPIINTIKGGTCLFIYSPNQKYLSNSPVLNS